MLTTHFLTMKTFTAGLVLSLCLFMLTPLYADTDGISKQRAVEIANQVFVGRVLSVKRRGDMYRVKKLSEHGEVRIIVIDAGSGKVLSD